MKTKIYALMFCALMLTACGTTEKNAELSDRWQEYKENMPEDKNAEDDFRQSEYMEEVKAFLSDSESMTLDEAQLKEKLGADDLRVLEKTVGEATLRLICVDFDIFNNAVIEVQIKNKYTFMQYSDGTSFYFSIIDNGSYLYPEAVNVFERNGGLCAVIVSENTEYHSAPVNVRAWEIKDGIAEANIFADFNAEGWNIESSGGSIYVGIKQTDGAAFEDIKRTFCDIDEENNKLVFTAGDESFTLTYDGSEYIYDGE